MLIQRESILAAYRIVAKAANKKSTLPILTTVRLDYHDGLLSLTSANLEQYIATTLPATGNDSLLVCLPSDELGNILLRMDGDELTIEPQPDGVSARFLCGRSRALLRGMDADEFPQFPNNSTPVCQIPTDSLMDALRWVSTSVAKDAVRAALNGIHIALHEDGKVVFTATDGYRLATRRVNGTQMQAEPKEFILPSPTAKMLLSIVHPDGKKAEMVQIGSCVNMNGLSFTVGVTTIVSALIDAEFPKYERILPNGYDLRYIVNDQDLRAALDLVHIYAKESANAVALTFSGENLNVHAKSTPIGAADADVPVLERQGTDEEIELTFNLEMLAEQVSVAQGPIAMELKISNREKRFATPIAIRPLETEDAIYLQMPMGGE